MRSNGILLPVFSLPGAYGIGTMGQAAYDFVDFLSKAGQKYWQILPLGPTGYGDSPYQSFSTFAGNPYFIDYDLLTKEGLLSRDDLNGFVFGTHPNYVDYERIYNCCFPVLRKAYENFKNKDHADYNEFVEKNSYWLDHYSLYMAIKSSLGGIGLMDWPEELRLKNPEVLSQKRNELQDEIGFYCFQQFYFMKQWSALKAYANEKGIEIIGDIPIYVALDSADTWSDSKLFQFDEEGLPKAVAGCPPDAFCDLGQLWGNPLYDWDYHEQTGYQWWVLRMKRCLELYDVIRVDHFRGFDSYYAIPYGMEDAKVGEWEEGPGLKLFDAIIKALGEIDIIAEDLGHLTPSVEELLKDSGFPGMKVLQFAFDRDNLSAYLPQYHIKNSVVYTGTHDNTTLIGYVRERYHEDRAFIREYLGIANDDENAIAEGIIRAAMRSVAERCIIPMQDYCKLGPEARVNQPATFGNNWKWRMTEDVFSEDMANRIARMTWMYGRLCEHKEEPETDELKQENSEQQ